MKKYRHFVKITSFCLSCIILLSICSVNSIVSYATGISDSDSVNESEPYVTNEVSIKEQSEIKQYKMGIQEFVEPILGDQPISNCEYMYNLDGSADYICVEFDGGGYAIFAKETMEMMEYNPIGNLPYSNTTASKYYAGPASYLYKSGNNEFVNAVSGEKTVISNAEIANASEKIREKIITPSDSKYEIDLSDFSTTGLSKQSEVNERDSSGTGLVWGSWVLASDFGAALIPNGDYFLSKPTIGRNYSGETYGNNNSGTCGPIAAQLLIGYHNYVNDRRIIPDKFLNGYDDATNTVIDTEKNPNYCEDPMTMNQYTTGTNSASTGANSFYCEIISRIMAPSQISSSIEDVRDGIISYLNDQITSSGYSIEYQYNSSTHLDNALIRSKLNRNTPVIIRLDNDFNSVDVEDPNYFHHQVVAYGYYNYFTEGSSKTYPGYIVHFGWLTTGYECVWVNALWSNAYIAVTINHTHNYNTVGAIPETDRTEYKCTTCGHRTDAAINMKVNDRYVERVSNLSWSGQKREDYYFTVTHSGRYLIQTFGTMDAAMYLYDSNYNQISWDDNSGSENNAMICFTLTAGQGYFLRVALNTINSSGSVKLGITPVSKFYIDFEGLYNMDSPASVHNFTSTIKTTEVITYTPTATRNFTFKTHYNSDNRIDTYMYLIDPYETTACMFNDDSGGDLQAQISKDLIAGRTYIVIISPYNFATISGDIGVMIYATP